MAVAPNKKIQIGLRLNLGYNSRFGLSENIFNEVLKKVRELNNLEIVALHVHVCEGERSVNAFEKKIGIYSEPAEKEEIDKEVDDEREGR